MLFENFVYHGVDSIGIKGSSYQPQAMGKEKE